MRHRFNGRGTKVLVIGSLASAAMLVLVGRSNAFDPQPDPPRARYEFPSWGLTSGETLRLTVSNTADPTTSKQECAVTLDFVDAAGRAVIAARRVSLAAGQTTFLDLQSAGLIDDRQPRAEVRARMQPASDRSGTTALPPGPCVPGVQVIDAASGRTVLSQTPLLVLVGV